MSEKFPELEDVLDSGDATGDFLSREKELLGDEFKTELDDQVADKVAGSDDEFEDFKSQFPEVGSSGATKNEAVEAEPEFKTTVEPPVVLEDKFGALDLNESEHIRSWKVQKESELLSREEISEKKLNDLKQEAEKSIDDFYDNYNIKKDTLIGTTREEEKKFLEKRDSFLENGTVWDRAIELLKLNKNSNAVDEATFRDKSRFRDLLLALKGKESVPGAAGY